VDYILAHAVQFFLFFAGLAGLVAALTAGIVVRRRSNSFFCSPVGKSLVDALLKKLVALEFGDANGISIQNEPTVDGLSAVMRAIRHSRAERCWIRVHLDKPQLESTGEELKLAQQLIAQYLSTTHSAFLFVNGCTTLFFHRINKKWKLVGLAASQAPRQHH
jgi:hypothetical protein